MAWNAGQKIVLAGTPVVQEKKLGSNATAASMLAGALVARDSSDEKIQENECATTRPTGWLGFEKAHPDYKPATVTTAYAASDFAPVIAGAGAVLVSKLAAGVAAVQGDYLAPWTSGLLVPVVRVGGSWALKVGFTKQTSEVDTTIDLPQYMVVKDCIIDCTTAVASGTIEVGLNEDVGGGGGEVGGDLDGFLDAESCATAGIVKHNMVDASAANNTLGALLVEVDIKDATGTPVYYSVPTVPGHVCDGTAKSLTYKTSNHAIIGNILLVLEAPRGSFEPVAIAEQAIAASSRGAVRSLI